MHADFLHEAKNLIKDGSTKRINLLIDTYRTQAIIEADFGSSLSFIQTISDEDYKTLEDQSWSVSAAAKYSEEVSVGIEASVLGDQRKASEQFTAKMRKTVVSIDAASVSKDPEMWASASKEDRITFRMKLKPIFELFSKKFMGKRKWIDEMRKRI